MAAATTATPTEATPLSTNAQPSPLKSSPRGPARMRSQKSDLAALQAETLREIGDFDLRAIPRNVDLYGLVKDFVVPRLPQGFCVRLEQQTPQSSSGQPQRQVMFLARQTHVRLGQAAAAAATPSACATDSAQPASSLGIGAEFLDTAEPAELFPPICFDKQLKFRSLARPPPVTPSGCYLFSQLIEDMDRLWRMQLPREQHEELLQQISEQLSPSGSQQDVSEELADELRPLSQELVEVLQPAAAAAAFAYYTGISFIRDSQLPAQDPDPATKPRSAGSQDSSDDDADDDDDEDSLLELLEGNVGNDSSAGGTLQQAFSGNSNSDNCDSET